MMNADSILNQTFVEHEWLAPDSELAKAELYRHLRARHHRRVRASLAVVSAAVAAAAVTLGAVQLGAVKPDRPDAGAVGSASAPVVPHKAPPAPRLVPMPNTLTLGAGWLPGGTTEVRNGNDDGSQYRGFMINGGGDPNREDWPSSYLQIAEEPEGLDRGFDADPRDLRINGKPALEFLGDKQYTLLVQLAPGRRLEVSVRDNASAEELATIGRRVAENVRWDRRDPIRSSFGLTYLPAGNHVRGVDRDVSLVGQGTTLYLDEPKAPSPHGFAEPNFQVAEADADGHATHVIIPREATVGRPVQGHRTKVAQNGIGAVLWVEGLLGKKSILISGGPGTLPELYKIAAGIRPTI
jgi:hypothetical protein